MSIFGADTSKLKLGLFGHLVRFLEKKTFIKPYEGPPVGPLTSGTYLPGCPKPEPTYRFFVQSGNGLWLFSVVALVNMTFVILPGAWMYMFNWRGRRMHHELAQEFGPTRYGKGLKYHS